MKKQHSNNSWKLKSYSLKQNIGMRKIPGKKIKRERNREGKNQKIGPGLKKKKKRKQRHHQ